MILGGHRAHFSVLWRAEIASVAGFLLQGPSCVDNSLWAILVEILREHTVEPFLFLQWVCLAWPTNIVPENGWAIECDELLQMCQREVLISMIIIRGAGHVLRGLVPLAELEGPVKAATVVETHLQAFVTDSVGELTDDVSQGMLVLRSSVWICRFRGPQAEGVVVLGREHGVLGARRLEGVGPLRRVPPPRPAVELGHEVIEVGLLGGGLAIALPVHLSSGTSRDDRRVKVPLRVRIVLRKVSLVRLRPLLKRILR
mmetsp:Transcript_76372/g.223986  ORF Transcript_76372/g.223986 Transcript_76372/m.223986 type:complete len:257 (+) Transcript_76372:679-1449(+)